MTKFPASDNIKRKNQRKKTDMTLQECFNQAKYSYDRALKFIDAMSVNLKKIKPDFDGETAKYEFDIILQYVLLRTALADGKFLSSEGMFIDSITDNFDILYLFDDVPDTLGWKWIAENQSLNKIEQVINGLRGLADRYIVDFISWFSALDVIEKEFDLLEILTHEMTKICVNFVYCDGDRAEDEVEVASRTVAEILSVPWKLKME